MVLKSGHKNTLKELIRGGKKMTIDNKKVELEMSRLCINKGELAERMNISRTRLRVILNSKKLTPVAVGRLAKALGVDVTAIIEAE